MKSRINTHALAATRFESTRLSVLATLVHPIEEEGPYHGTVLRDGRPIGKFRLEADRASDAPQTDLDLARFAKNARGRASARGRSFRIAADGYLVLYVSEGTGDFQVVLERVGPEGSDKRERVERALREEWKKGEKRPVERERPERVFDSRTLGPGDRYALALIRPGTYRMADLAGKREGRIAVAYPRPGETPFSPGEPARVTVTDEGIDPEKVEIRAGEGVVFEVRTEDTALLVELEKPDDGGRGRDRPPTRWRRPGE